MRDRNRRKREREGMRDRNRRKRERERRDER